MKYEICSFSGFKIAPGRGIRYIRLDGRNLLFANRKCLRRYIHKRKPRQVAWTQFYRRAHKKNVDLQTKRKKVKKITRIRRGFVGASMDVIRARRTEGEEIRAATKIQAIKHMKEKKRQKEVVRKEKRKANLPQQRHQKSRTGGQKQKRTGKRF